MITSSIRNWFYEERTTEERLELMKRYVPRRESYLGIPDKKYFPTGVSVWYPDTIATREK